MKSGVHAKVSLPPSRRSSRPAPPDTLTAAEGPASVAPPPAASPVAPADLLRDGDLTDFELDFFSTTSSTPAPLLVDDADDETGPPVLSDEQWQRRLWFRRQVTRLMAGLGAFSAVVVGARLAALL